MELVYLWVEEYKNIKNQGFNFSTKFNCNFYAKFDENNQLENFCKLEINRTNINSIFPEKINLTAIVGRNGSGKSSLLEILSNKYSLVEYQRLFFVFFDSDKNLLQLCGAKKEHKGWIELSELDNQNKFNISVIEDISVIDDTKTIYFSNLLNENDLGLPSFFVDRSYSNMVNISTSHLLNQRKLIETKIQAINSESMTGFDKVYRSYRIQQIQSAIIAIQNGLKLPFDIPEELVIRNINFEGLFERLINDSDNESFRRILEVIKNNNSKKTIFKNYLKMNLVVDLLLENREAINPMSSILSEIVLNQKMGSSLEQFYDNVESSLKMYFETYPYIRDFFKNANKLISQIDEVTKNIQLKHKNYEIVLDIQSTDFSFLETYEKIIQQSEYFWNISWRGLSSGEETFLYQFSRFYFLKQNYKDNPFMNLKIDNKLVNNIILLIDEGEVTLHPEWQKNYISYLVEFLKENFTQNIHLILTTHSPFILSDIPNENLIFLDKVDKDTKEKYPNLDIDNLEYGMCVNVSKDIEIKTFGANIHTLLTHGFFMENGLMGKFAKEKLESILKYLTKEKDSIDLSKVEIKYIINSVGEELLTKKLQSLYNDFYQVDKTNEEFYLERIAELEAKLKVKNHD
ncbi:AAA family ATPase [Aliarcobacter lanthieri]|uniref:AAA family ATPase n=1 Tax=Aliarcobacter lanthieri TaxID=1355374 RepID=UPI00047BF159|nr:AAA family ATPase [Aliarcobacter lanthieri]QKF59295.1 ATP-binding protein (AAA domain) [Aliarcobacter lanthieri]